MMIASANKAPLRKTREQVRRGSNIKTKALLQNYDNESKRVEKQNPFKSAKSNHFELQRDENNQKNKNQKGHTSEKIISNENMMLHQSSKQIRRNLNNTKDRHSEERGNCNDTFNSFVKFEMSDIFPSQGYSKKCRIWSPFKAGNVSYSASNEKGQNGKSLSSRSTLITRNKLSIMSAFTKSLLVNICKRSTKDSRKRSNIASTSEARKKSKHSRQVVPVTEKHVKHQSMLKQESDSLRIINSERQEIIVDGERLTPSNVLLNLNISNSVSTIISLKELFDIESQCLTPLSNSIIEECIEELIMNSPQVPRRKRNFLLRCLHESSYNIHFTIKDNKYTFDKSKSKKYFRYCIRNNVVPVLNVHFYDMNSLLQISN